MNIPFIKISIYDKCDAMHRLHNFTHPHEKKLNQSKPSHSMVCECKLRINSLPKRKHIMKWAKRDVYLTLVEKFKTNI